MKSFSNTYIFIFSVIMVVVIALLLSLAAMQLKPFQDKNIEIEKKRNILASIRIPSTVNDAVDLYAKYITDSFVLNNKGEKKEGANAFTVDMKAEISKPSVARSLPCIRCTTARERTLGTHLGLYLLPAGSEYHLWSGLRPPG
jgi:Na+-transporting NADH:ubiquinone oxidoreductase subunit C